MILQNISTFTADQRNLKNIPRNIPQVSCTTTNAYISSTRQMGTRNTIATKTAETGSNLNIFLRLKIFSVCSFNVQKKHNNLLALKIISDVCVINFLSLSSLLFIQIFCRLSTAAVYLFLLVVARPKHNNCRQNLKPRFFFCCVDFPSTQSLS